LAKPVLRLCRCEAGRGSFVGNDSIFVHGCAELYAINGWARGTYARFIWVSEPRRRKAE
jgi:hypothetical protein